MDDMLKPDSTEALAERIAAPLRSAETLSPGFEERLMSRVRAERINAPTEGRPIRERSWWMSPRVRSRTPLASVMLAVGLAVLVSFSTLTVARANLQPALVAAAATDTVYVVRFVFLDSNASRIALVGDFNGWTPSATPLRLNDETNMWTATVALPPGQHEYAFIIDGQRWAADPFALTTTDEFGTKSSLVSVGSSDVASTE